MNFTKHKPEGIQFQLAPMIDVVFLLLTFFITSTIFAQWETEVDINLPVAETGQTPQRRLGEVIINVYPDGRTVINQREFPPEALAGFLQTVAENDQFSIIIRGDENTPYREIVRVMDLCRQADIFAIRFATGIPEGP